MPSTPPSDVLGCLRRAGNALNEHLEVLAWPDANRDTPAKEANIVLHVARELMQASPGFHVYLEAAVPGGGQLDLLAANDHSAIALEAKCFGDVGGQSSSLLRDVLRLKNFHPRYALLKGKVEANDWWKQVPNRWAFAVIASFCGSGQVAEAWDSGSSSSLKPDDRAGFDSLIKGLDGAYREVIPINDGSHWNSCGYICLLIAAFEV